MPEAFLSTAICPTTQERTGHKQFEEQQSQVLLFTLLVMDFKLWSYQVSESSGLYHLQIIKCIKGNFSILSCTPSVGLCDCSLSCKTCLKDCSKIGVHIKYTKWCRQRNLLGNMHSFPAELVVHLSLARYVMYASNQHKELIKLYKRELMIKSQHPPAICLTLIWS